MNSLRNLRVKRPPVNIRLQSGQTAELMAIAMTLQAGLRTALEHLAAQHEFKEGPWLDEVERALIADASNIWSQGIPLDMELRAMEGGRKLIEALTNALRKQLRD